MSRVMSMTTFAIRWLSHNSFDEVKDGSGDGLVRHAAIHYLNPCRPIYKSPYGVTMSNGYAYTPQWTTTKMD